MTVIQSIRKRDGRVVPFHENKIADAINKAFAATYKPGYEDTAASLAHEVASILEDRVKSAKNAETVARRAGIDESYFTAVEETAKQLIEHLLDKMMPPGSGK